MKFNGAVGVGLLGAIVVIALGSCAAPQPAPVHTVVRTPVRVDPAHPPRIGVASYPTESIARREEGVCKVKLTVNADGTVQVGALTLSTGFSRLDQACLDAFVDSRFLPTTEDGRPVTKTAEIPITWKLAPPPSK